MTADELEEYRTADGYLDLTMTVELNGQVLSRDSLASASWTFGEMIAYASAGTWVAPGDVFGSGTCGGRLPGGDLGAGRAPRARAPVPRRRRDADRRGHRHGQQPRGRGPSRRLPPAGPPAFSRPPPLAAGIATPATLHRGRDPFASYPGFYR